MGFTKLDECILRSSIMAAKPKTFKVWIALLAACEADGIARVSTTFLSRVCYLSLEDVKVAIGELSAPDTESRTPDHEGRRIERCDGGYTVFNYPKYRSSIIVEASRIYERERKRSGKVPEDSGIIPESSASASASASLNSKGEECEKGEAAGKQKITFDTEAASFEGITAEKRELWQKAFPAVDIDQELAKAAAWIIENPAKGHKSNWGRFLTNWLSRTQDRGGTRGGQANRSAARPRTAEEVHAEFEAARVKRGF